MGEKLVCNTGSRLTNVSCAMSLDSNYVVLSTMPSVFVDVGLPKLILTVLVDRSLLGSQCCLSTGLVANGIHLTKR